MRCLFHPDATATTLCARCGRALCPPCIDPKAAVRVCAAGCGARPAPAAPDTAAVQFRAHLSRWARWARVGATAFLVGLGAATLHFATLSLAGYGASLLCLTVAWHRRRHPYPSPYAYRSTGWAG